MQKTVDRTSSNGLTFIFLIAAFILNIGIYFVSSLFLLHILNTATYDMNTVKIISVSMSTISSFVCLFIYKNKITDPNLNEWVGLTILTGLILNWIIVALWFV